MSLLVCTLTDFQASFLIECLYMVIYVVFYSNSNSKNEKIKN